MNKISLRSFFIIQLFLQLIVISDASSKTTCDLACTIRKLDREGQYEKIDDVFFKAMNRAIKCEDIKNTIVFLKAESAVKRHGEIEEAFWETIERDLFLDKTDCFFKALLQVDNATRDHIIDNFKTPLVLDKKEIDNVIRKYKSNPKYKQLIRRFPVESN